MNPAVSLVAALGRDIGWREAARFVPIQVTALTFGVWMTHLMFGLPILETSDKLREGVGHWAGEFVATFGLLVTIDGTSRYKSEAIAGTVAGYITSAYWFTSSTSLASPAVAIARSPSDSFAGIAPVDAPGFIAAQLVGALNGSAVASCLFPKAPL